MIYEFNDIYNFLFKILIIVIVTFIAYKKEKNYKCWFLNALISPYIGGISFIIILLLRKINKINNELEEFFTKQVLKYEIYIVIVSFLILGVVLNLNKFLV
jgi:hypothetical protein